MKVVGRNDQCPCKSGKKFKFCCIHEAKKAKEKEFLDQRLVISQDPEWFHLRQAEGNIEAVLEEYIDHEFNYSDFDDAWDEFMSFGESEEIDLNTFKLFFKSWSKTSLTIASAMAFRSFWSKYKTASPATSCNTGILETAVLTPQAKDCKTGIPKPSYFDGKIKALAAFII